MSRRVRQRRDEAIWLAGALFADRDLKRKLPPVTLADLARQVAGSLAPLG